MAYRDFNAIYAMANDLYEIKINNPATFEEIALIGFDRIGNKRLRTYHAVLDVKQDEDGWYSELPCNCDYIEAVTLEWGENWQYTSNKYLEGDWNSMYNENYIESRKVNKGILYEPGIFAKYEKVGDTIYFKTPYKKVHLLYRGQLLDENGLPQVTDKEVVAIATFVAMTQTKKEAWKLKDAKLLQFAESLEREWHRLCSNARVPEHISQNEMDRILDANTSFNRKTHNWSFKPTR